MDFEPSQNVIVGEVLSNVSNEVAKAIAVVMGFDAISAAAVGGATGGLIKSGHPPFLKWLERRRGRLATAIDAAREVANDDLDHLLAAALQSDGKLDLLAQALEVAQKTADERRVRFYGRIAAQGILAQDEAHVDAAQRIFSSIATLDPVDLKVLLHMSTHSDRRWHKRTIEGKPPEEGGGPSLASTLPEVESVLDAAVARLENLGLITGNFGSNFLSTPAAWQITEFGHLCVTELLDQSEQSCS